MAESAEAGGGNVKGVLCVGGITLNMVHECNKFPREGETAKSEKMKWGIGGHAVHTVMVLRQLGACCSFLGPLAEDSSLNFFSQELSQFDISLVHCPIRKGKPMSISCIVKNKENNSRTTLVADQDLTELTFDEFREFVSKRLDLKDVAWVHFEGRNVQETKKMMEYIQARRQAEKLPVKISLKIQEPHQGVEVLFNKPDVLFVGRTYARAKGYANMNACCMTVSKGAWANSKVICTWGDKGSCATIAGGSPRDNVQIPATPPKKFVDAVGAGDTFVGGCIFALLYDKPLDKSINFGSKLASYKMSQDGFVFADMAVE